MGLPQWCGRHCSVNGLRGNYGRRHRVWGKGLGGDTCRLPDSQRAVLPEHRTLLRWATLRPQDFSLAAGSVGAGPAPRRGRCVTMWRLTLWSQLSCTASGAYCLSKWEILWFSASQFPLSGDIFVLISHQGERHPRKFSCQDHQCLGRRFSCRALFLIKLFPCR